ncbi:MAG: caspase family protein [Saprospiraceae bacterium]
MESFTKKSIIVYSLLYKLLLGISFLFLINSSSDLLGQAKVSKKALLIGVGTYPASGGWATLNSKNDLVLIKEALLSQGFIDENIITISDSFATKKNILEVINNKLIKEAKKGDIIYFHFSGHGQQKQDLDGDEIDGYDECIVPYDSPKKFNPGVYEGEKLISDDELNKVLLTLRKQLTSTGQLIVALDACHSGTGTRGGGTARGTSEPMASSDYIQKNLKQKLVKENNQVSESASLKNANLASMIAFFGSSQNQVNYEMTNDQGVQYGSLSYALSKNLIISKKAESYRGLFDKIKIEMANIAPLQQPQAEGDLDTEILNGKALGSANYYKVISGSQDAQIVINAGFLQGVNTGSVVGFFLRETRDFENSKPIVIGTVKRANAASSEITIDTAIDFKILAESWVYIIEKSMGDIKVEIDLKIKDATVSEKVKAKLLSYPFIKEDSKNAKLFIYDKELSSGQNYLFLSTLNNFILDSSLIETMTTGSLIKLTKLITNYLRGQFLRKLEITSEDINLSFEIIPVGSGNLDPDNLVPLKADASGLKSLKMGDQFQLYIINDGMKPAYFNVIDIQPDNTFSFLLPCQELTVEELRIAPGQKKLMTKIFGILPPKGNEVFKLIASSKPLDLISAYGTRGNKTQDPFEKMFSQTENPEFYNTRGGKPVSLGNMEINTYSMSFYITN